MILINPINNIKSNKLFEKNILRLIFTYLIQPIETPHSSTLLNWLNNNKKEIQYQKISDIYEIYMEQHNDHNIDFQFAEEIIRLFLHRFDIQIILLFLRYCSSYLLTHTQLTSLASRLTFKLAYDINSHSNSRMISIHIQTQEVNILYYEYRIHPLIRYQFYHTQTRILYQTRVLHQTRSKYTLLEY